MIVVWCGISIFCRQLIIMFFVTVLKNTADKPRRTAWNWGMVWRRCLPWEAKGTYSGGFCNMGHFASSNTTPAVFTHDAPGYTRGVHTCFPADRVWWFVVCNWGGDWWGLGKTNAFWWIRLQLVFSDTGVLWAAYLVSWVPPDCLSRACAPPLMSTLW